MPWYLVIRQNMKPAPGALERHLRWLHAEHERGVVLISGPDPEHTRSLLVVRAPSSEAAEAIVRGDPLDHDGRATLDIIEWHVHQLLGIGSFDTGTSHSGDSKE
jgi:uncharacterized protein YciI